MRVWVKTYGLLVIISIYERRPMCGCRSKRHAKHSSRNQCQAFCCFVISVIPNIVIILVGYFDVTEALRHLRSALVL